MSLNSGKPVASHLWLMLVILLGAAPGKVWAVQDNQPAIPTLLAGQITQIAEQYNSSLVQIEMTGGPEGQIVRTTGTLIDDQGFLLTHATELQTPPDNILVTDHLGQAHVGKWIAVDHLYNLLLIKTDPIKVTAFSPPLNPDQVAQGQSVVALGKMLDPRSVHVSKGIVSATGRIWGKAIQTDAKISPLNYGGPLLDLQGRLLGILVPLSLEPRQNKSGLQWYDSGIGFAVPLAGYQQRLQQLKQGMDIQQGLSGIQLGTANNNASSFPVERIRVGSPAYGILTEGDQISEINGTPINSLSDYYHQYYRLAAGDRMEIRWQRDTETLAATLELVAELEPVEFLALGCLALETETGMEVLASLPVSALKVQDRIVEIHGQPVKNAEQLEAALLTDGLPATLTVTVVRGGTKVELSLTPLSLTGWLNETNWVQTMLPNPTVDFVASEIEVPGLKVAAQLWRPSQPTENVSMPGPCLIFLRDSLLSDDLWKQQWKSWAETFGIPVLICGPQEQKWTSDDAACVEQYVQQLQADYPQLLGRRRILLTEGDSGAVGSLLLSRKDPLLIGGVFLESEAQAGDLSAWENLPGQRRMFLNVGPGEDAPRWIPFFQNQKIPAVHLQQDGAGPIDWKTTLGIWIWSTRML